MGSVVTEKQDTSYLVIKRGESFRDVFLVMIRVMPVIHLYTLIREVNAGLVQFKLV